MPVSSAGIALTALWTLCAAWLLTPTFASRARARDWLDHPSARKSHASPVPRVGGIALFVALGAGLGLLLASGSPDASWVRWGVLLAGAFAIGIADDLGRLATREKLAAQVVLAGLAGVWLEWAGVGIGPFGSITFGWLSPLMTALWVFAVLTVVNFIDGIDLITACVATVLLGVGVGWGAGPGDGTFYLLALGALAGVGFWNVTPARVFLGDAGTHVLGVLVALLPMALRGEAAALSPVPWAMASAPLLPCVLDIGLGIVHKLRHNVPVHAAHNDHIYQRLTKAGGSHAASALRYGLLAVVGVLLVRLSPRFGLVGTLVLAGIVLALHLGHAAWTTRDVPHEFGEQA